MRTTTTVYNNEDGPSTITTMHGRTRRRAQTFLLTAKRDQGSGYFFAVFSFFF